MNEDLLTFIYTEYGLDSKGTFEEFQADMKKTDMQRFVFDTYLSDKGTFDEFQSDLRNNNLELGESLDEIKDRREEAFSLSDDDFQNELQRRQQITDEAFKNGEGDSFLQRRGKGLYKAFGNLVVDVEALMLTVGEKFNMDMDAMRGRFEQNSKELKLLEAEIPTSLKQTPFAKFVEFEDKEVELDPDGEVRSVTDLDGFKTDVDQEFLDRFKESGKSSEAKRKFKGRSFAQQAEQTIIDVGVMMLGTKGATGFAKGATKGLSREAQKKVVQNVGRATVGTTAFVQSFGDNYTQALDDFNGDSDKAANVAFEKSALTAVLTTLMPGVETGGLIKNQTTQQLLNTVVRDGTKTGGQKVASALSSIGLEILEENADQIGSNAIDILNGLDGDLITTEEFLNTTVMSAFIGAPGAYMNARQKVSGGVVLDGVIEAAKNPEAYDTFTQILQESDQAEELKIQKIDLVNKVRDNLSVVDNLSEDQEKKLAAALWNKTKFENILVGDIDPKVAETVNNEITKVDEEIAEIVGIEASGSIATTEIEASQEGDSETPSDSPISGLFTESEVEPVVEQEEELDVEPVEEVVDENGEVVTEPDQEPAVEEGEVEPVVEEQETEPKKSKRDTFIDNVLRTPENLDQYKEQFEDPRDFYDANRDTFLENGVTPRDVAHVYNNLDPRLSVEEYANQRAKVIQDAETSMKENGFSDRQIADTKTVFAQAARAWAKQNNRTPDEYFTDVLSGFESVADPNSLKGQGNTVTQADNVKKNTIDRIVETAPEEQAENWRKIKDNNEVSSPYLEDKALEGLNLQEDEEVIRGARKVLLDGSSVIQITQNANPSTVMHELAHVYELHLNNDDRAEVLKWTGERRWSTGTSEAFARGFEQFLNEGQSSPNKRLNNVFGRFKNWLNGIYNGIVQDGNKPVVLNSKMREIYAKMFDSEVPVVQPEQAYDNVKQKYEESQPGVKFNKALYDDLLAKHWDNPNAVYNSVTVKEVIKDAVEKGYNNIDVAQNLTFNAFEKIQSVPEGKYVELGLSASQAFGISDALLKINDRIDQIESGVVDNDTSMPDNLEDLKTISNAMSSVLSYWRSQSGAHLGLGSKFISQGLFTDFFINNEVSKINKARKNKGKKELSTEDVAKLKKLAKDGAKLEREFRQLENELRSPFSQALESPILKKAMNSLKDFTPTERKQKRTEAFDRIEKYFNQRATKFDSNVDREDVVMRDFLTTIASIIVDNPNIDDLSKLMEAVHEERPNILENDVVDALTHVFKTQPDKAREELKKRRADIRKEAKLLDKIDALLNPFTNEESFKKAPKNETQFNESIENLKSIIEELGNLLSKNPNTRNFESLMNQLHDLETRYGEFMLRNFEINKKFGELNIDDVKMMLENFKAFKDMRKVDMNKSYNERIVELDQDIESLKNNEDYENSMALARKYNLLYDPPPVRSKELREKRREIETKKRAIRNFLDSQLNNGLAREILNIPRFLKLSMDYSFFNYQGGMILWKMLTGKDFRTAIGLITNSVRSSVSQNFYDNYVKSLQDMQNGNADPASKYAYYHALEYGINIGGIETGKIEEELQIKSVLERIPGLGKLFGAGRNFSERGYNSFMGALRIHEFARISEGITDPKLLEELAEQVNTKTGSAKKFFKDDRRNRVVNSALDGTKDIFIAPRLYASVFKSMWNLAKTPQFLYKSKKNDGELGKYYRAIYRQNMGIIRGQLALTALSFMLTATFGDEDDMKDFVNIYESTFLKAVNGQTVTMINPMTSYYRLMSRVGNKVAQAAVGRDAGQSRTQISQSPWDIISDEFLSTRFNPLITAVARMGFNKDYRWQWVPEEERGVINKFLIKPFAPIVLEGVVDNIREERYDQILKEFALDIVGANSFTRDPIQHTTVQKVFDNADFNHRISYPPALSEENFEGSDAERQLARKKFKIEVNDRFANRVLSSDRELTEQDLKTIKREIIGEVKEELGY